MARNIKWVNLEDDMCRQVHLARQIMHLLSEADIDITNDTVEALRIVANVAMDKCLHMTE